MTKGMFSSNFLCDGSRMVVFMASKIKVKIGTIYIGGGEKIAIQSMTNSKTSDIMSTVAQIKSLEECGCEIVRATVNDEQAALAIDQIKEKITISLVADIHFDYKLALLAIERGIDKIRINPGNIGDIANVEKIVKACKTKNIPIRIGVNGGSLPKDLIEKYGGVTPSAMIEAGKRQVELLEKLDFFDIVLSFKISDVEKNIEVYNLANEIFPYPLHLGVTEAGGGISGIVKNSIGIGTLLREGIGDTLRVSLTDPVETEIETAKSILMATNKRKEWVEIISCPTCGRTDIDIMKLSREIEAKTKHIKKHIKVAVMGCVVNGPGEAKDCDIGIAGGSGQAILFKQGNIIQTIKEEEIISILLKEIEEI
jgi:(E)-4-hydroxy-3-methylbut-2-enyl-diphosphate synthase